MSINYGGHGGRSSETDLKTLKSHLKNGTQGQKMLIEGVKMHLKLQHLKFIKVTKNTTFRYSRV